eukprot:1317676-Prymnesium_polylepis.1
MRSGPVHMRAGALHAYAWVVWASAPLGTRGGRRVRPQVLRRLHVEDFVRLVVFIDRLPAAASAAAAQDRAVLLEGLLTTPLARPAVPRPVDARLGAARVVCHLHQAHARLLLTHEAAGDVLHEDGEVPV